MYTVHVYASAMPLPIPFLLHTWVVVSDSTTTERFDVMGFHEDGPWERTGYVYKNYHRPGEGCPVLALGTRRLLQNTLRWRGRELCTLQGEEGSPVHGIWKLLRSAPEAYPHAHRFGLVFGPNCNTFTQWVLDQAAPGSCTLPWNAFGRNFKRNT